MVPSTRWLERFRLLPHPPGFVLQYPHQASPSELTPFEPYPRLFATFAEAGEWLDRLAIRGTGRAERRDPSTAACRKCRWSPRRCTKRASPASRVTSSPRQEDVRVVLIAGPSSSGKTTFSKRLAVQLLASGRRPFAIALDDYFLDRDQTPRDERGELDFEALEALDVAADQPAPARADGRPRHDAPALLVPHGHPRRGRRRDAGTARHHPARGHPRAEPEARAGRCRPELRVPHLRVGDHAAQPRSPQPRLDLRHAAAAADRPGRRHSRVPRRQTLRRWDSVQRGERLHIFPFTENSDAIFNSSLAHELSVLRPFAEPLLLQVRPDSAVYREANRLLSFLQWFRPAPDVMPCPTTRSCASSSADRFSRTFSGAVRSSAVALRAPQANIRILGFRARSGRFRKPRHTPRGAGT